MWSILFNAKMLKLVGSKPTSQNKSQKQPKVNKLKRSELGFCVISWPSSANWFKVEDVISETESVEKAGPQTWLRLTWLLSYLSPQLSFEMSSNRLICFGLLFLITFGHVTSQRTSLDVALKNVYRPLRLLGLAFTGRSGDDPQNVQRVQIAGVSPADNAIIDPDPNGSVFPFVWH